jgi:hypothetical protein
MDKKWHRGGHARNICRKLDEGGGEIYLSPILDGFKKVTLVILMKTLS